MNKQKKLAQKYSKNHTVIVIFVLGYFNLNHSIYMYMIWFRYFKTSYVLYVLSVLRCWRHHGHLSVLHARSGHQKDSWWRR